MVIQRLIRHWFSIVTSAVLLPSSIISQLDDYIPSTRLLRGRNLNELYKLLPYVIILPISPHQQNLNYFSSRRASSSLSQVGGKHKEGHRLLHFLSKSYECMVPWPAVNATKNNNYSDDRLELFFIPSMDLDGTIYQSENFFTRLDQQISVIARQVPNRWQFALDRCFLSATWPWQTKYIQISRPYHRNIMDIRMLRSDNDMTVNGRDVFIPYHDNRRKWRILREEMMQYPSQGDDFAFYYGQRSFFLTAICYPAKGYIDSLRNYREALYSQWHNVTDSIVSHDFIPGNLFDHYYLNSDFCIILPGDTSSTAKLYKAIFAGCIPVIFISFPMQLPFIELLDWSLFAIIAYKDDIFHHSRMQQVLQSLLQIREDPVRLMMYKKYLYEAARVLDYSLESWPSVYHFILLSIVLSSGSHYMQ